jgi:2-phospho-L-lactate guanylyltransferase (CobY/MobA/RfbA family)
MNILLIPIAPLFRTKSRLRKCFSKKQLKDLTIAMFKDLALKLKEVECFNYKIVYCNSKEILDLAETFGLIGIKENLTSPRKTFDEVINDLNQIAINEYNAQSTVFTFLDIILIAVQNFYEISKLTKENQLVICPAISSAGISILGRNPADIIPTFFSDRYIPSLLALLDAAEKAKIKTAIYDSFRAGFDIDIKQDLVLAYQYLKIFGLSDSETYTFLKKNLNLNLMKKNTKDNRMFKIS